MELPVTGAIQGATPLSFDGATDDTNELTFAITDPNSRPNRYIPKRFRHCNLSGDTLPVMLQLLSILMGVPPATLLLIQLH
ncbi:MAG: hypothetical protein R3B38_00475 [Patescibacteria group bacterium]